MSGRKINDHASFAGKGGEYPLPTGNKMKSFKSAEGAGHVGSSYHDTSEEIHSDQMSRDAKTKAHKMKPGYRN